MTPNQRKIHEQLLRDCIIRKGFVTDRFGNLVKSVDGKDYRMKFNPNNLRYETKVIFSNGASEWIRLRSGVISQLTINEKDQIVGLK